MTDQQKLAAQDQEEKIELLLELHKQGINELGFFGKAGVGKTRSAKELANRISKLRTGNSKIIGATIAHSAKNILKESLGDSIEVLTIAALLQLQRTVDENTGEITFEPGTVYRWDAVSKRKVRVTPPIFSADILIIDECSQISHNLKNMIDEYKKEDAVVIYLGDNHQTPPVDEDKIPNADSPTFDVEHVKLTIPFRYEGELQLLADAIAQEIDKFNETGDCSFSFLKEYALTESEAYTFLRQKDEFKQLALEEFKQSVHLKQSSVVCYRNDTVKQDTKYYRDELMQTPDTYVEGDKLVCKSS